MATPAYELRAELTVTEYRLKFNFDVRTCGSPQVRRTRMRVWSTAIDVRDNGYASAG